MTKKIWLLLLSLFVIFWFWVSLANPIAMDDYRELPDICYRLKNVEIDGYKVIIEYGERDIRKKQTDWSVRANPDKRQREIYEPKAKECTKCSSSWKSKVYLLDKNISTADITQENIDTLAIYVWDIYDSDCTSHYDIINTYKITNNWNNYEIVSSDTKNLEKIRKFSLLRLLAVIIETIVLFFTAKLFRKKNELVQEIWYEKNELSNKKLLLWWVIPTTITLPLLWFVLPLLIWDWIRYTIIWETLVTVIEAIIIKYWLNIPRKRAIIASIICNLFSFLVLSFKNWEGIRNLYIRLFLLWFLIQPIILLIMGKWLRKRNDISNNRFVITWIIAPIVTTLLLILSWLTLNRYIENRLIFLILWITIFILTFAIEIKFWLKASWKEATIMAIVCNLSLIVLLFVFYLIVYKFYD